MILFQILQLKFDISTINRWLTKKKSLNIYLTKDCENYILFEFLI